MVGILLTLLSAVSAYVSIPLHSSKIPAWNFKKPIISLLDSPKGAIPVHNYYNLQYYATFQVGTPGQDISFILDTGSSWTWVPSTGCDCHNLTNTFNKNLSSTYIGSGNLTYLLYGQGYVEGELFKDTISLGGLDVQNQEMVLAYKNMDLEGLASDGLLGLGFKELSDGVPTVIDNMFNQGTIQERVFSLYLNNFNYDNIYDSALTIGGYDAKYADGPGVTIKSLDLVGFWLNIIDSVSFAGNKSTDRAYAILDIGTSFLYGPDYEVDMILNTINNTSTCQYDEDGYFYCDCDYDNLDIFPSIEFVIENNTFTISPYSYMLYDNETNNICYVFIDYTGATYWLLGQVFFREYYSVYDMDNYTVQMFPAVKGPIFDRSLNSYGYMIKGLAAGVSFLALAVVVQLRRTTRDSGVDYNRIV